MVFPIVGGNQSTGDFVTNSLRLNDDDSPSLSIDLSSPNTDKFTISFWVKLTGARSYVASLGKRLTGETGDDASINIDQGETGRLGVSAYNGVADSNVAAYNSNTGAGALLRDTTAWYHLVYAFDTGQGTAANRFKWYINGVLQSGYNTTTTPSQNADLFPSSGSMFRIGRSLSVETRYADCYLAQYYYVDGQQYDHTYFGKTDDNGVWVPVENGKGAGGAITFGTNGFYLEFKETGTSANSSGIGADTSGNDNHLTPANLASTDITIDTPQNNFCILNFLHKSTSNVVLSEGNLKVVLNQSTGWQHAAGTIAVKNGKWYWEAKALSVAATDKTSIGVLQFDTTDVDFVNVTNTDRSSKGISGHGAGTGSYTYAEGDIIMCGMDLDNNKVYWGKNGTWFGSLDPAAGSGSTTQTISNANFCVPVVGGYGTSSWELNFGVPQFSISSGNSDANGYGNFEYSVPSGFFALNTKNLAEHG